MPAQIITKYIQILLVFVIGVRFAGAIEEQLTHLKVKLILGQSAEGYSGYNAIMCKGTRVSGAQTQRLINEVFSSEWCK